MNCGLAEDQGITCEYCVYNETCEILKELNEKYHDRAHKLSYSYVLYGVFRHDCALELPLHINNVLHPYILYDFTNSS